MGASATSDLTGSRQDPYGALQRAAACVVESSFIGMLLVSRHGEVVTANQRMADLLQAANPGELAERTMTGDLLPEVTDWSTWSKAFADGQRRNITLTLKGMAGGMISLTGDLVRVGDAHGKPDLLLGTFVDHVHTEQLQRAIQTTARMEALGSLTSGIAHDVNNLLTVLVGNLYLVGEELRENPALFEKIKPARDAARRGADLLRQLLSFSRREPAIASPISPARVVDGLEPLLRQIMGKRVTLSCRLDVNAGPVVTSAAQLESVVVNLAINARDAINNAGAITISVVNRSLGEREAKAAGVMAGDYAMLSVADDGCGIPDELRERIFEPFFTTKQSRGGSGLGLSMVRWFAEQYKGTAFVRSRSGKGTVVSVLLPRHADLAGDTSAKTMPLSTLPTGNERVLVLAQDEALRSTIRETLQVLGYVIRLSGTDQEFFDEVNTGKVDLVIMDGDAGTGLGVDVLVRRARALCAGMAVIVTGSDTGDDVGDADGQAGGSTRQDSGRGLDQKSAGAWITLAKPFSLADFASTVRRTLDGRNHA